MSKSSPLVAGAVVLFFYLILEWLFLATMPSFLGMLSPLSQLGLLSTGFLVLAPILLASLFIVSKVSVRLAMLTVATISGCLLFLLLDNFLYTVAKVGTLGSGGGLRPLYTALLFALVFLSYRKLTTVDFTRRSLRIGVGAVSLLLLLVTVIARASSSSSRPHRLEVEAAGTTPNVVLIGMDGVDASALSVYEPGLDTAPFLSSVADDFLVFTSAFPDSAKTTGTTTALLTGRSPLDTRVGFPPQVLLGADSFLHLPAVLNRLGYTGFQHAVRYYADAIDLNFRDAFAQANGRRPPLRAFERTAFMHYFNNETFFLQALGERLLKRLKYVLYLEDMVNLFFLVERHQGLNLDYDRKAVTAFREFVRAARRPFYAHVHFMSSHCCQHNPSSAAFSPELFRDLDPHRARGMADRFNAIRDVDSLIREIYSFLEAEDLLESSIVVVYSDHSYNWDTLKPVPLMMRFPRGTYAGTYSGDVLVSTVPALLLDYLDLQRPPWMRSDGELRQISSSDTGPPKPLFALRSFAYQGYALGQDALWKILHPGPPNYGIKELSLVLCSKPFSASLATGLIRGGELSGHPSPCPEPEPEAIRGLFQRAAKEHGLVWGQ